MIEAKSVKKIYRTERVETCALDGVDLTVPASEFLAIMGPSGSGKSTLLTLLGLLDSATDGSLEFEGQQVVGLNERQRTRIRRGRIGFVFQSFNLIENMTVEDNVALPLVYLRTPRSKRRDLVAQALEKSRIDHRRSHLPGELSGGQQQRAAIARAIVAEPSLILADEPTGNLDSKNGEATLELLREVNGREGTLIMVTHSEEHAKRADRIVRLFDGRIHETEDHRLAPSIGYNGPQIATAAEASASADLAPSTRY